MREVAASFYSGFLALLDKENTDEPLKAACLNACVVLQEACPHAVPEVDQQIMQHSVSILQKCNAVCSCVIISQSDIRCE